MVFAGVSFFSCLGVGSSFLASTVRQACELIMASRAT